MRTDRGSGLYLQHAMFGRPPVSHRATRFVAIGVICAAVATPTGALAQIYRLPHPDEKPGDYFGVSVDLERYRAVVGASGSDACGQDSGAAYIYEADSTTGHWNHVFTLIPDDCMEGDFFGRSLDMSGDRVVVAAFRPTRMTSRPNAAYLFERDPETGIWSQRERFSEVPERDEGAYAAAVAMEGDYVVVTTSGDAIGDRYHGAGYVYRRDSTEVGSWHLSQRIVPSESPRSGAFGTSAVMRDGTMVIGASTYLANRPGSAYFAELDSASGRWQIRQRFGGLDDFFLPVDVRGKRAIVGESRAGGDGSGRATVFERADNGTWVRSSVLRPARPFEHGAFGSNVSLGDGRALVVGFDEQLQFEFNIDRVVYVFEHSRPGEWRQRHIVDVGEVAFGVGLAVDGRIALIGQAADAQPGTAYIVHLY